MIRYLSYIYDMRANNGVNCSASTLQLAFRVDSNKLAKDLAPAFKKGLLTTRRHISYVLTREGEKYVENYRYGETADRDNKEQSEG